MGNLAPSATDQNDSWEENGWEEDDDWEDSSAHCGDCGAYAVRQRIDDDGSIEYRCEACGWFVTVSPEDRS
jgi:predicted RNA-binding Zn-ribbon protein involved in translation (DUF1610 family)